MSAGTLYTSFGSGNSCKVRLLASILGIDLKREEISLKLSFAEGWVQYDVFTNRAILSYGWPYNGLGPGAHWPQSSLDVCLQKGAIRGKKSQCVLDQQLKAGLWLTLGRPTFVDISAFVYIPLAPMGDISLVPYPAVKAWTEKAKGLRGFFGFEGLDNPMIHRR